MNIQIATTRLASATVIACALIAGCNSESTSLNTPIEDTPDTGPLLDPNQAPTAANACLQDAVTGGNLIGQLDQHAEDPDGDALQFALSSNAQKGTVEIDLASGQFTYRPTTSERGYSDYFTYTVTDSDGATAEATMELVVGERRIMPFGDSITAGVVYYSGATGDRPLIPNRVGYRKRLNEALRTDGYPIDFVGSEQAGAAAGLADSDHQGHPGFKTAQLTANVGAWLDANPADVMLIHVGTNDLSRNAAPIEQLLTAITNWQTLNHPVELLVATIIDHHADTFWDDVVEDFNADLRQRLETNWPDVTLVDQYAALDNVTHMSSLLRDTVGLHPNGAGYRNMSETWFDSLTASAAVAKCG